MKMEIRKLGLALCLGLLVAVTLAGCSWLDPVGAKSGPTTTRSTYSGDENSPPVYTSPTTPAPAKSLETTNAEPAGH